VASHINIKLLGELSQGFYETQILDLIQYGFPLDPDKSSFLPNFAVTNHGSALQFPAEVDNYFHEEIHFGAMLGPFPDTPFPDLHCSPLMTAPKDSNKRCIIVDLSFPSPAGHAVNLSVNKISYVGTPFSITTVDTICQALNIMGNTTKIFKVDLVRALRQLHIEPFDVKYLGLRWGGSYYVCSVRVSSRYPSLCMCNGPHPLHTFTHGHLCSKLYRQYYRHRPRSYRRHSFFKIGTIQIPHIKLQEVLSLCKFYFSKSKITKKQLQALLGSLKVRLH
jgi:hypothetical protein